MLDVRRSCRPQAEVPCHICRDECLRFWVCLMGGGEEEAEMIKLMVARGWVQRQEQRPARPTGYGSRNIRALTSAVCPRQTPSGLPDSLSQTQMDLSDPPPVTKRARLCESANALTSTFCDGIGPAPGMLPGVMLGVLPQRFAAIDGFLIDRTDRRRCCGGCGSDEAASPPPLLPSPPPALP